MKILEPIHQAYLLDRRVRILSQHLANAIPQDAKVLDVGCGDGKIAWHVQRLRPDLQIQGVDILVRGQTLIPVESFDGEHLPASQGQFDVVLFVDVLHHCNDPMQLLREARRAAGDAIVIKDHTNQGMGAGPTLRLMDRVGNRRHGVALPFNYWHPEQWQQAIAELDVHVDLWLNRLGIYPWPATMVFDRLLHFVARWSVSSISPQQAEPLCASRAT